MADLADFYPASQAPPQTVNGTQPVVPRAATPAGMASAGGGLAGAPTFWVLALAAGSLLLLHLGE